MAFYRICPNCGAYLDPGERCDCQDERKKPDEEVERIIRQEELIRRKRAKENRLQRMAG